jgi:hypothetical protein
MIKVGPTGKTVKGHVLDVSYKPFVQTLKAYDPYLYVTWNSQKLKGWGCYEIRRAPEVNSVAEIYELKDCTVVRLEPCEVNIVNHVLDCAFLNYDQLRRIKDMDVWKLGPTKERAAQSFLNNIDYKEDKAAKIGMEKARSAARYATKHFKRELSNLKEEVRSGWNPHNIGSMWNQVDEAE